MFEFDTEPSKKCSNSKFSNPFKVRKMFEFDTEPSKNVRIRNFRTFFRFEKCSNSILSLQKMFEFEIFEPILASKSPNSEISNLICEFVSSLYRAVSKELKARSTSFI